MLRTLKNLFKQDREKFVVPKSVQNVIPIKTIWDDGIFLVGRNKYANGYAEEGQERYFTPEELFCCEFAPYFMEGIKVRYPEYCRELPAPRKQTEISR